MASHWSGEKEKKGSLWQMRFVFFLYRILGFKGFRFFLHPVAFFFFLFSPSSRRISRDFQEKVARQKNCGQKVSGLQIYRHFFSFSHALIEKLAAWAGDLHSSKLIEMTQDITSLKEALQKKQGAVILCSHLGNVEMLRALANNESGDYIPEFQVQSVVDFSVTSNFNQLLKEVNPESMVKLINASSIGPDSIIYLRQRIEAGDLVVIAADRTARNNRQKNTELTFLGQEAAFPQGAFVLAILLEAPVYYMFGLRQQDLNYSSPYEFHVYRSKIQFDAARRNRQQCINQATQEFAGYLENLCLEHPLQWYNFFDFWAKAHNE